MSFAIALTDLEWAMVADLFDPPGRREATAQIPRRHCGGRAALHRSSGAGVSWHEGRVMRADGWKTLPHRFRAVDLSPALGGNST